jgi:sugar lactone lactonase YvrE
MLLLLFTIGRLQPLAAQQPPQRFLAWEASLQGEEGGDLRWPVGVATASALELGVADAFENRLVIFVFTSGSWSYFKTVSLPASPKAVAHDGQRYVLSLNGGQLVEVKGPDFGVRRLRIPSIAVAEWVAARPGGGFWVHDAARGKVFAVNADGTVLAEVSVKGRLDALAGAPDGGFFAALAATAEIRRYDAEGEMLETWTVPGEGPVPAWPSGLVGAPGGDLVVADRHGGRIVALDAGGRPVGIGSGRGWELGRLRFPTGIARLPNGSIVVADQGNSRVQIFRPLKEATP